DRRPPPAPAPPRPSRRSCTSSTPTCSRPRRRRAARLRRTPRALRPPGPPSRSPGSASRPPRPPVVRAGGRFDNRYFFALTINEIFTIPPMQLPDLDSLRCFAEAARLLSFSAAARAVGLTPAALGGRIARLETDVGAPLFLRTTRHVALTQAGL